MTSKPSIGALLESVEAAIDAAELLPAYSREKDQAIEVINDVLDEVAQAITGGPEVVVQETADFMRWLATVQAPKDQQKRKCPHCGHLNDQSRKRCQKCYRSLEVRRA